MSLFPKMKPNYLKNERSLILFYFSFFQHQCERDFAHMFGFYIVLSRMVGVIYVKLNNIIIMNSIIVKYRFRLSYKCVESDFINCLFVV